MATETHPPSTTPIPDDAYMIPTPDEVAMNESYWKGYEAGKAIRASTPSPKGSRAYDIYRTWINPMLLPPDVQGFPNQVAVGYNNAVIQGANYLWTHDPESPYKIPPV